MNSLYFLLAMALLSPNCPNTKSVSGSPAFLCHMWSFVVNCSFVWLVVVSKWPLVASTHSLTSAAIFPSRCADRLKALSTFGSIHLGSRSSPHERIRFSSTCLISRSGIRPLTRQLAVWKRSSSLLPKSNILWSPVAFVVSCGLHLWFSI